MVYNKLLYVHLIYYTLTCLRGGWGFVVPQSKKTYSLINLLPCQADTHPFNTFKLFELK